MAADIKITALLETSGSFKEATKEAKELNSELSKTKKLLEDIRKLDKDAPSTKAARSSQQSPSRAASNVVVSVHGAESRKQYRAPAQVADIEEYGRGRAAIGTGAAGRDFAQQAQGLGGLVRLYATYAANIFAVSAAFTALREAANTDIMIRGMDKLGSSSGVAMGALAKQFAQASDGAISFRESMEATTKAISSGMSSKQLMDLGVVAKGASQALGVNMSDAVSRLTRGITKLEPELLDELGIFTKVGKSTEEYAKSVNKSVDSLTDFEKRQAFANAVIAEGITKFGAIAEEANPYDKLLASLKNTLQGILSAINSFIMPFAKLLADNTALITAAIVLISAKIVKQALPALSSWRAGLKHAADDAAKRAREINTSFGEAFVERYEAKFKLPDVRKDISKVKEEIKAIDEEFVQKQAYKRPGQSSVLKAVKEGRLLTEKEIVTANKEVTRYSERQEESAKRHASLLAKRLDAQKRLINLQKEESVIQDKIVDVSTKEARFGSGEWQREQIVKGATARKAGLDLLSGVGERVEKKGFYAGMSGFYSDVASSKDLTKLGKLKTGVLGTFAGIATGAEILASSLSKVFVYIEIGIAVFTAMYYLFSKNGKEIDSFNSKLDNLSETVKTGIDVNKKYGTSLNTESINARANAFASLADSIRETTIALEEADKKASWFDRFLDGFKSVLGKDLRSKFEEGLSEGIISAIKAAPEGEIRGNLVQKLQKTTGTLDLSKEGLLKAFAKLDNEGIKALGVLVGEDLKITKKYLGEVQAITQDLKDTGKSVNDAYISLKNSIEDKSPVNTFLAASIKQATVLEKALENVTSAQLALVNIATGEIKPEFLTKATALAIMPLAEEAAALDQSSKSYLNNLDTANAKIAEINAKIEKESIGWGDGVAGFYANQMEEQLKIIDASYEGLGKINKRIKELAEQSKKLIKDSISAQIDESIRQTKLQLEKASNEFKQSIISKVPVKTAETILYSEKLQKQAVEIDRQMFKSQESLVRSLDLLAIQVRRDADLRELEKLEKQRKEGTDDQTSRARESQLRGRISSADATIQAYTSKDLTQLTELAKSDNVARNLLSSLQGFILANEGFNTKLKSISMDTSLQLLELNTTKQIQDITNSIELLKATLDTIPETGSENIARRRELEGRIKNLEDRKNIEIPSQAKLSGISILKQFMPKKDQQGMSAILSSELATRGDLASQTSVAGATRIAEDINKKRADAVTKKQEELEIEKAGRDIVALGIQQEEDRGRTILTYLREEISLRERVGEINTQEAKDQLQAVAIREALIEKQNKFRAAEEQLAVSIGEYEKAKIANGGVESALLIKQKELYEATYNAAIDGADEAYKAQVRLIELQNRYNDRQLTYLTAIQEAFTGIADAMVEWAKTGKWSASQVFGSLIEGIVRYELRLKMLALWAEAKPMIMQMFGFGDKWVETSTGLNILSSDIGPKAKGAAYDLGGVEKFAKGGMFTNSIVNTPTLFKFAKGTGLMGEAGPEAIMPLKRDSQGNLGVRTTQPQQKTEVIVNNYSGQKAEAKETQDGRGNRRIEIVVGDMTAGEVSRSGSNTNKAIRTNFGLQPQLIRR